MGPVAVLWPRTSPVAVDGPFAEATQPRDRPSERRAYGERVSHWRRLDGQGWAGERSHRPTIDRRDPLIYTVSAVNELLVREYSHNRRHTLPTGSPVEAYHVAGTQP